MIFLIVFHLYCPTTQITRRISTHLNLHVSAKVLHVKYFSIYVIKYKDKSPSAPKMTIAKIKAKKIRIPDNLFPEIFFPILLLNISSDNASRAIHNGIPPNKIMAHPVVEFGKCG